MNQSITIYISIVTELLKSSKLNSNFYTNIIQKYTSLISFINLQTFPHRVEWVKRVSENYEFELDLDMHFQVFTP